MLILEASGILQIFGQILWAKAAWYSGLQTGTYIWWVICKCPEILQIFEASGKLQIFGQILWAKAAWYSGPQTGSGRLSYYILSLGRQGGCCWCSKCSQNWIQLLRIWEINFPSLQCAVQSKAKMFWILFSFSFYVGDVCHMQLRPVMYISQPILQVLCQYNVPDLKIFHSFLLWFWYTGGHFSRHT